MGWMIGFTISILVLLAAVATAIFLGMGRYKRGRICTPFNVLFGGLFISVFVCMLPIYHGILYSDSNNTLKTIMFSLHNTF